MDNSKVVATVQGSPITEQQVNEMAASLAQRGQNFNNPQGREMIIEELIARKLFLIDAVKNMYDREKDFIDELAKVKDEILTNYAVKKVLGNIKLTDAEVKDYYDAHKSEFKSNETVKASHILVDSEQKANELFEKITKGDITFEDAAKEHSSCPSSQNGGDLGEFGRGQMVPEFEKACFEMNIGDISNPVKTQFGYHIIKLTAKNDAKELDYNTVKPQIEAQLTAEKQRAAYQSKINQLKILYPVNKMM